jgi:methionyl-tRNA formyltransferase
MSSKLRIVFYGTPEFAQASLQALVENSGDNGYEIVGVVTSPDRPAGRGLQVRESAVKAYAVAQEIPVLQPKNLKDKGFLEELAALKADLQVIVAFRMLPEAVWAMPPKGSFNLHASMLPEYRGAAPIHWAVLNGEKETGLTTFFLKHAIDTGNILLQEKIDIGPDETTGELHDRMKVAGGKLVAETVKAILEGNIEPKAQDLAGKYKRAPKLDKELPRIDWNNTAQDLHNKIRGLSPYPGAVSEFDGGPMKIYRSAIHPLEDGDQNSPIGTRRLSKSKMFFRAQDGWIEVLVMQLPGKRAMTTEEFLRGWKPDFARQS